MLNCYTLFTLHTLLLLLPHLVIYKKYGHREADTVDFDYSIRKLVS